MHSLLLFLLVGLLALPLQAGDSIYQIPLKTIDGEPATLPQGKVLLIVNVASRCGHTKQYAGLQSLYEKYKDRGFEVLGFPCNQFGQQEPGTAADIKSFCSTTYQVTFPLFEKLQVNGPERHLLYQQLAGSASPFPGDVQWNFAKFLVSRDGTLLKRFAPGIKPDSAELISAIEAALAPQ